MNPNPDYLVLIQGVITRMANNAFLVKGWSVTLTAALLAVGGSLSNMDSFNQPLFLVINCGCILFFLWLDSYFYYNEKKYRELYDYACDTSRFKNEHLFNLNPNLLTPESEDNSLSLRLSVIKSSAVYPLYLMQIALSIIIYLFVI
ncbi:TPA: hypothetical protein NJ575_004631 [Vibrio parahaemolyticus]|uniref:hypothetical protein n=1 Tax=Vibrio parahaemolyticus TaxID=670 RepID=UPI0009471B19|nr:hypothetical protein [Vibrio parahaemolyticus]OLF42300.1 hypothetical protein BUQ66_24040 [Vibrio parahaemolyticus]HCG8581357.1 hypothetical protein [Vibrio parahaemolyticus]HCM1082206.1 hypothetical protein [Vibrio parahaemolyticus]